jgi:2-oxoglutarate dehydrogenase E1 component
MAHALQQTLPHSNETDALNIFSAANAVFLAELYARYLEAPDSVDASWASVFQQLYQESTPLLSSLNNNGGVHSGGNFPTPAPSAPWGPSWQQTRPQIIGVSEPSPPLTDMNKQAKSKERERERGKDSQNPPPNNKVAIAQTVKTDDKKAGETSISPQELRQRTLDSIRALMLIRAYRIRGHLIANLDPLGLQPRTHHPELDPASYGFQEQDLDRDIFIDHVLNRETASLRQILAAVRRIYCGTIGIEFMHIQDPEQKAWIQRHVENTDYQQSLNNSEKRAIFAELVRAEAFEKFLHTKYTGTKRFGLDGGEALIPMMEEVLRHGASLGVDEVVLGMAHRGRLNVLANVMQKPFVAIFSEFQGKAANPEDVQGSGDVKYHLGTSTDRDFSSRRVHLSLTANPSHLEAVDPVVLGKARAKQAQRGVDLDTARAMVMPILLHGDAAFAGQGLVAETLEMSDLRGYRVGGCIHIIINNQIGFTTRPTDARSGPYATELAKAIQAPIIHVNGDDPEAVVFVARMAMAYRQKFRRDIVIDLWCYRRHGHNEGDEPSFTQPAMYRAIAHHPTTRTLYGQKLIDDGTMPAQEVEAEYNRFMAHLEEQFKAADSYRPNKADWLEGKWAKMAVASGEERRGHTSVSADLLQEIAASMVQVPSDFSLNAKIARQFATRLDNVKRGEDIDWSTAEALAFGSLCLEGTSVRLSGQDCGRGTFSQRHAALYDQESERKYVPLAHLRSVQGNFEVIDSPLAEASVLGFEYGYSLAEPHTLVLWEAQFGDFVNGAQVIIDQFISSGESKWLRMSGLVMLLPHGFEGQGPEHSSGRLERFLQLCAEDNLQVCNLTTPANYFHALRRQMRREFRKPLVIMTPKSLLRHKLCVSKLADFTGNSSFHRLLPETNSQLVADKAIKRVVLCSGKVYYDLVAEREKQAIRDIALLRLEQFYPWPQNSLKAELSRYPNAELVWCQEEPENMGAWSFVRHRLDGLRREIGVAKTPLHYAGRPEAASPATGMLRRHNEEQARLIATALAL